MTRMWRKARWLLLAILLFAALSSIPALKLPGFSFVNNFLRTHLVDYINATFEGKITIGQFHLPVWGPITLDDVTLSYRDRQIASISKVSIGYELLPLLRKRIVLSSLDVFRPLIDLAREPDGQWNLAAALKERKPSTSKSSFSLMLRGIGIKQGDAHVETAPSVAYNVSQFSAAGSARMNQPQEHFKFSSLDFALNGPKVPGTAHVKGGIEYDQAQVATIKVNSLNVNTNQSDVLVDGTLHDLASKHISATINLKKLAASDVDTVLPAANLAANLNGIVRLTGQGSNLQADLALNSGPAHVNAALRADIAKTQPPWGIEAQLVKVDLHKLLKPAVAAQLPGGVINAIVKANAVAFNRPSIKGTLNAQIADVSMRGMQFGDLSVTASVLKQVADINANLKGANAAGSAKGKIEITRNPSYQLALVLDHLHPARLTGSTTIPKADLNFTAEIGGVGYQPATMRTQARIKWLRSTVERVTIDSGLIDARIAGGIAQIAGVSFRAGQTTLEANGNLALTANHAGNLNYRVAIGQLSQWLQIAGHKGSGQLQMAGRVTGDLSRLRAIGSAQLRQVKFDKYSVAQGSMTYDVGGLGKQMKPDGRVNLAMADLRAGVQLKTLRSEVRLIPGKFETAALSADATDRLSHAATVRTDIVFGPKQQLSADLNQVSIGTNHGTWNLVRPAQFIKKGQSIEIHNFAAHNQNQNVALQGVIAFAGPQDLTGRIQALRISDFSSYFPQAAHLNGLLSADLAVRGSASAPTISLSTDVNRLDIDRVAYARIAARLSYRQGQAQAQTTITQDPAHSLEGSATLPMQLSWSQGFQAKVTGDLDAHAVSPGINLAFLNSFATRQVSGIDGILAVNISAHGPLTHPAPSGFLRIIDAHATARPLAVDVTDISANVQLNPGEIRIAGFSAKAGKGTVTGGGFATLGPDGRPRLFNLSVQAEKWPAIQTTEYHATSDARINLTGTMETPNISGQVEVLYGVMRPNVLLTGSKPHLDRTIAVVRQWQAIPAQPPPPPAPQPPDIGPLPASLAVNVGVVIDRNTWIKTADFAVELEGRLHLVKKRNEQLIIAGAITTVRGTVVVADRQFDVKRGQILFTGGHQLNPELDLLAQIQVPNYLVSVNINGSADKPKLTLSSIPDLPQSDILSVIMFGKPANQLSGNQQQNLQNQALSMAGGYAAAQIGHAVAQALGLSELGVTTTSGGVGLGRYITKNLYVSATQSSANMQDRRAGFQYYITPNITINSSASTNYGNEVTLQWQKEY
jgi:autotransporter translocation and assembly factor TamB